MTFMLIYVKLILEATARNPLDLNTLRQITTAYKQACVEYHGPSEEADLCIREFTYIMDTFGPLLLCKFKPTLSNAGTGSALYHSFPIVPDDLIRIKKSGRKAKKASHTQPERFTGLFDKIPL